MPKAAKRVLDYPIVSFVGTALCEKKGKYWERIEKMWQ